MRMSKIRFAALELDHLMLRSPVNIAHLDGANTADRMADRLTSLFGSWRFLGYMTCFIMVWITLNVLAVQMRWDPYPFILLNLVFSTQASYAAPLDPAGAESGRCVTAYRPNTIFNCNQRAEAKINLILERLGIDRDQITAINQSLGR